MAESKTVDYGPSLFRAVLTWGVYPLCVLVPFAVALIIIDPGNPAAVLPLGVLSLFTAGIMEWVHPHTL